VVTASTKRAHPEDPIDILMREHEEVIGYLGRISRSTLSIERNGFSAEAFREIAESVRFIGTAVRQHSDKEDQYLFPLLERHAAESPVSLRHERREMWHLFNELMKSVNDVEDGRIHGTTIRELIQLAHEVVERFQGHITKENTTLFPLAKRLLTPVEYDKLTRGIAEAASSRPL
jgi:hemerythrin-like domain-containing protein